MSWHDEETLGSVHVPYNWEYANAAARTGASGFSSGDVGKLARQTDDNSLWMLTATTPTWIAAGGGGAPVAHAATHKGGGSDEIDAATTSVNGLMSSGDKTKLDGVETGADVTDAANVNSAGAVMEADYDANTMLAATSDDTPAALTVNASTIVGRKATGPIAAMSASEARAILNVADGADVTGSNAPQAHAASHQSGGGDAIKLDNLATPDDNTDLDATTSLHGLLPKLGGGSANFLRADGTWAAPTGGSLVKLFQGVDTTGGMTVTNVAQTVALDVETIKDDYYTHSTSVNPGEVTILEDGWYKISAMLTVASQSTSGGIRGNPVLNIEVDTGSGFVAMPDKMGGYVREDGTIPLSASITGIGFFEFDANDKIRITTYDLAATEPDEATVAYSSRLLIEYIDRTGAASGTVDNLKDIGDVEAAAPAPAAKLFFNENTSDWEQEDLPMLAYGIVKCEDWAPTWAQLYAHGSVIIVNTAVSLNGFVGNATVATINGLSPTANDSYLVTDAGTITSGSVAVTAGALVVYTGASWVLTMAGVGGYAQEGIRVQLSSTTALISPYTDGTDDGKIIFFDGTSNTGTFTTLDVEITLPDPSDLPADDGMLRRVFVGMMGGDGGHAHLIIANSGEFIDGLEMADIEYNGKALMLGAFNGALATTWQRISGLEDHIQLRRAATWAATNFSTATPLPLDTEDITGNPTISSWALTPNPSRVDVDFAAHYHVSGFANIDSTGGSTWTCEAYLRKNGTTEVPGSRLRNGNYGGEDGMLVLPVLGVHLEDGDYIEWVFDQVSLTGNLHSATLSLMCRY